jgi:hypothetical protein
MTIEGVTFNFVLTPIIPQLSQRWSGNTRNSQRINIVHLNPEKKIDEKELQAEQKNAA